MSVVEISPEEQIRRVARTLLSLSERAGPLDPSSHRADVHGLIEMIERHLHGDLPPIAVSAEGEALRRFRHLETAPDH